MDDPFSAAIAQAVETAFERRLHSIIEAVRTAVIEPTSPDRFVPIAEAARLLGMSPSTAWRLERIGKLPPREKIAGRRGYRQSTIDTILKGVGTGPLPLPANPIKAGEKRGGRKAKAVRP